MAEKTNVYPYRAPKKYPKKDLHGRPRFLLLSYNDFKRFQKFYVNVFGWDMFELPEAAAAQKKAATNRRFLSRRDRAMRLGKDLIPGI